jgi:hypothetical protein
LGGRKGEVEAGEQRRSRGFGAGLSQTRKALGWFCHRIQVIGSLPALFVLVKFLQFAGTSAEFVVSQYNVIDALSRSRMQCLLL